MTNRENAINRMLEVVKGLGFKNYTVMKTLGGFSRIVADGMDSTSLLFKDEKMVVITSKSETEIPYSSTLSVEVQKNQFVEKDMFVFFDENIVHKVFVD